MKLTSGFAALLIATSVVGGGLISGCGSQSGSSNQIQVLEPLKPLKVEQIDKIASEITVLIDTSSSGSGVLIAKQRGWFDTTYYVLTAKHVIQGKNEFDIVTPDGERYRRSQNDVVEYLPDADLAVVQFASSKQYALAKLTDWDFQNRSVFFDAREFKDKPWIFVSGFPDPKQEAEFPKQKRLFSTGTLKNATDSPFSSSDSSLNNGYELTYTASTYRGMSGSPVLDTSGRLIGIHGRNTGEQIEGNRRIVLGDSIGVPISKLLKATSGKLQKITASLAIDKNVPLKTVDAPFEYQIALLRQDYQIIGKSCRDDRCLNYINRLIRGGAYKDAFRLIEDYLIVNENRKFYPAWYLRGSILFALGRYEESLSSYEESVRLNPNFYEARSSQCSILWASLKQNEKAVTVCDQGIEIIKRLEKSGNLQVKPFSIWHQKAQALKNMGLDKEAIVAYDVAISILPNPHSYLNRGASRVLDFKGAIEDYSQAIKLNPNYTQAYINRALSRLYIEDKDGASQDLDMAAKINAEYTVEQISTKNFSNLLFGSNELNSLDIFIKKKSIEIYTNLISQQTSSSNLSDWYKNRCILQSEFDIKNAIEDCNKSLELNPSSVDVYNVRASLYKALSDYPKSLSDYSKHIELLPKSQTYSLMLSHSGKCEVFFRMKQYEPALQECQLAIKVHPDTPPIKESNGRIEFSKAMLTKADLYHLTSNVYSELGDNKMALQSVSSAIILNEFNGYFYIDRALYISRSMQFYRDTDTKIISLGVDNVDKSSKMIEDLEKASQWLKNDENGRKILKRNIDGHIRFFSSIQQDEKVQSILAKLKKLE